MNLLLLLSLAVLYTETDAAKDTKAQAKTTQIDTDHEEKATHNINDRVVATVMGTQIKQSHVLQILQMQYDVQRMKPEDIERVFNNVLEQLIAMHLINKLYAKDYVNNKEYNEAVETAKATVTYQYYMQKLFAGKTNEDFEAYYNEKKQTLPLPMRYTALACNCKKKEHAEEMITEMQKGATPAKALENVNKKHGVKYTFRTLQDEYGNDGVTIANIRNAQNEVKLTLLKYDHPISSDKAMVHQSAIKATDKSGASEFVVLYLQNVTTGTIDDFPAYTDKLNQQLISEMLQEKISELTKKYEKQIQYTNNNGADAE